MARYSRLVGFGPSAPFLFGALLSFLAGLVFMVYVR